MTGSTPGRGWRLGAVLAALVALACVAALVVRTVTAPGDVEGDGLAALTPTASASPSPATATDGPAPTPSVRATARAADPGAIEANDDAAPPVRLRIPDLGVAADVRPVGVQDDGAMVIPAAPTSVGWYRYGSAPSTPRGHTVIAGHVATREDGPGALAPLSGAREGMRIEVTDADGEEHTYEVTGRESVRKKALPVDEIFARDGEPRLVLITCGGEYLPELRAHRDNVVVTAAPVD
ncbi:class F sortase [Arthrobacter sp. NEB 688]|uniref:class F sortase n=1 Tax=Arthrobacter sp. NEB 688 TaxID=904039 RepID=UPI001563931D|nr:class F sortase [Arthrobacter sp. NEB 688]QKE83429.1 class F sortase [Arthrobacter sp. NEB 688]